MDINKKSWHYKFIKCFRNEDINRIHNMSSYIEAFVISVIRFSLIGGPLFFYLAYKFLLSNDIGLFLLGIISVFIGIFGTAMDISIVHKFLERTEINFVDNEEKHDIAKDEDYTGMVTFDK